jgi:hypothetical protein
MSIICELSNERCCCIASALFNIIPPVFIGTIVGDCEMCIILLGLDEECGHFIPDRHAAALYETDVCPLPTGMFCVYTRLVEMGIGRYSILSLFDTPNLHTRSLWLHPPRQSTLSCAVHI